MRRGKRKGQQQRTLENPLRAKKLSALGVFPDSCELILPAMVPLDKDWTVPRTYTEKHPLNENIQGAVGSPLVIIVQGTWGRE